MHTFYFMVTALLHFTRHLLFIVFSVCCLLFINRVSLSVSLLDGPYFVSHLLNFDDYDLTPYTFGCISERASGFSVLHNFPWRHPTPLECLVVIAENWLIKQNLLVVTDRS